MMDMIRNAAIGYVNTIIAKQNVRQNVIIINIFLIELTFLFLFSCPLNSDCKKLLT